MEDNTVLVMGERQERSRWGWLGDVHSLRLGESASQHAAVTTATVTCRPTAGARPTTVRPNYRPWERENNEIQPRTDVG